MHQLFQNLISNALKFTANRQPVVTIEGGFLDPDQKSLFQIILPISHSEQRVAVVN